jgi:hypothetical protein
MSEMTSPIRTNRETFGFDFEIGAQWDAGCTGPTDRRRGRWTVRREPARFVVLFVDTTARADDWLARSPNTGEYERILGAYPGTDAGEVDAKTRAVSAMLHHEYQAEPPREIAPCS